MKSLPNTLMLIEVFSHLLEKTQFLLDNFGIIIYDKMFFHLFNI